MVDRALMDYVLLPRRSHGMWQMLRVYGVGGELVKAVQSFYVDSRACGRVGNDVSEWFPVNVGLRQGGLCDVSMVV